jgi:hypothetical protein
MAEKLKVEQQELKLELAAANDRASALTARLEQLAVKDGPPEQQLLAALSEKLVRLEVSERNAVRRSELAQERMKSIEKDSLRSQDRILALEEVRLSCSWAWRGRGRGWCVVCVRFGLASPQCRYCSPTARSRARVRVNRGNDSSRQHVCR